MTGTKFIIQNGNFVCGTFPKRVKRVKQRNLATCQVNLGQNLLWPILLTWICILPSFALKTLHIFVARALTWFKFLNKYEKVLF